MARFTVEVFEHPMPFRQLWNEQNAEAVYDAKMRLVHAFIVEAKDPEDAADKVFEIGNAPWNPEDAVGETWDHTKNRSFSMGDVVVVKTGQVEPNGYVCLSLGWAPVEPWRLDIA